MPYLLVKAMKIVNSGVVQCGKVDMMELCLLFAVLCDLLVSLLLSVAAAVATKAMFCYFAVKELQCRLYFMCLSHHRKCHAI